MKNLDKLKNYIDIEYYFNYLLNHNYITHDFNDLLKSAKFRYCNNRIELSFNNFRSLFYVIWYINIPNVILTLLTNDNKYQIQLALNLLE